MEVWLVVGNVKKHLVKRVFLRVYHNVSRLQSFQAATSEGKRINSPLQVMLTPLIIYLINFCGEIFLTT